jgi:hypothetical protein
LSFAKARKHVRQIEEVELANSLQLFEGSSVHLSLDAGTIHVNSIVDFSPRGFPILAGRKSALTRQSWKSGEIEGTFCAPDGDDENRPDDICMRNLPIWNLLN